MIQSFTHGPLAGITITVEQRRARYNLPDDVPPGTGSTREEFAEWSKRVCGYSDPLIPDGQMVGIGLNQVVMNANTYDGVLKALKDISQ